MQASRFPGDDTRRLRRMRWLTVGLLALLGMSAVGAVLNALGG